ncbi:hypothetical protein Verru16b_02626 [Lacunisphaera limnophila]|uniref:Uncharacterized protein n=1 Tax=Lacunisphaera limnophila TaxID=1838286 RepID=A0A1D8AXB9_9BACT|nr:hypothetical protein [Lacunisphaera limnophila]AOS45545.1 hypothetical protein Verru16b_02626 [Lacunisphaera limnophila]
MKTIASILSRFVAAGTAAVALLTLTGLVPADLGIATLATLGLAAIALLDYSRPVASLTVPAQILRPTLPSAVKAPAARLTRRAA